MPTPEGIGELHENNAFFHPELSYRDALNSDTRDALEIARCVYATLGNRCGVVSLTFDREAGFLGKAIGSARLDTEKAGYKVATVEKPATVG